MRPMASVREVTFVRKSLACRFTILATAALALAVTASLAVPAAAVAAPAPLAAGPLALAPGDIDEGGSKSLRDQLEAASKGFLEAKAALEKSTKRQKELTALLKQVEEDLDKHTATLGEVANSAYRTGRLGPVAALLDSGSPDAFLHRAAALVPVAAHEDRAVRQLLQAREQHTRAKAAIDKEIAEQRKQVEVMRKRKEQAERALAAAGSSGSGGGFGSGGSGTARPAPRNPDGSFPSESCSVDDPTTSGCITPRMLHALNQAKAAGFTRFVSCFRSGGSGEHPKGRACDFSAQRNGFGGVATGGDRTYGDNLANFFIKNADRLGVLYVIWFKQIWLPSSGFRAYNGGGDPSSDHTNHVHLSVI